MDNQSCKNCLYGGIQICRRYPPDSNGRFKFILEDWRTWCGEYRAAEKKVEAVAASYNTASPKNLLALWKCVIGKFFGRC